MRRTSNLVTRERRRYARNYNVNQVSNDERLEAKEREARRILVYQRLLEVHEQHQKDKEEKQG